MFFDNLSLWFNDANLAHQNASKFWLTQDSANITSPLGEFGFNFDIIETNILNLEQEKQDLLK